MVGGPLFLRASAGSGKTHRLVLEYLRLLLKNPTAYRSILAITFTNDATAEMKSRIIRELKLLRENGESKMAADLLDIGTRQELSEKAGRALQYLLHDYSNFAVMTIDGFFQMVLRSFSRELKLPVGYVVELDSDIVLEYAVESLLAKIGSDDSLTSWICEYARANLSEGKTWNIELQVKEMARELFKEMSQHREWNKAGNVAEILVPFQKSLWAAKNGFESKMAELGRRGMELADCFSVTAADVPSGMLIKYFDKIQHGDYDPKAILSKVFFNGEHIWKASAHQSVKDKLQSCLDAGLQEVIAEIADALQNGMVSYNSACAALQHIYSLGLLGWLQDYIRQFRNEESSLLISDTLSLLGSLICNENTPFIYEKIGIRFRHVLIDEFQDTSRMQWGNLVPLVLHLLSQGGRVLMVGDAKQSIYRWRGGDMELILGKGAADLESFKPAFEPLNMNYRSRENIIRFNNGFFRWLCDYLSEDAICQKLLPVYDDFQQQSPENKKEGGYVNVRYFDKTDEATAKQEALSALPALIKEVCSRGYRPGDIGILVRGNDLAAEVSHILVSENINVETPQSLMLAADQRVQLMISALRHMQNPAEKLYKVAVAQKYAIVHSIELPDEAVFNLELSTQMNPVTEFFKVSRQWKAETLGELNEKIVNLLLGSTMADAYFLEWQDCIQKFIAETSSRPDAFLEWWEERGQDTTVQVAESPQSVKVMTIHKSKGLEFPVVIMPFAKWDVMPKAHHLLWVNADEKPYSSVPYIPVSFSKKLESSYFAEDYSEEVAASIIDSVNLLYVACTRAENELYIFTPVSSDPYENRFNDVYKYFNALPDHVEKVGVGQITENGFEFGERPIARIAGDAETSTPLYEYRSGAPESKINLISFSSEATEKGIDWHKLMFDISGLEDITPALRKYVFTHSNSEMEEAVLGKKIRHLLDMEKELLNGEQYAILAERSLFWNGEIIRPDKVYINGSNCIVIDYKTGKAETSHKNQVKKYISALAASGYNPVGAFLIYTDVPEVVGVEVSNLALF